MPLFSPAHAQDASQAESETAEEAPNAGNDIVVTARRREELLQEVPVAVTAFTGEDLEKRGINDITDLQQTVPSLNLGTSTTTGGRKSISPALRGVRSNAVTIYFADVVQNAVATSDLLYDLESVQVLKGPQGTLFGANSTGGAILFQPTRPKNEVEAFVEGRVGNYNRWGVTGMVNVPLSDAVSVRIAADKEKRSGYLKGPVRAYDADDHWSVRGSLKFENDFARNWFVASYYEYDAQGSANVPLSYRPCPAAPTATDLAVLPGCLFRPQNTRFPTLGVPTAEAAYGAEIGNGIRRTNITGSYPRTVKNTVLSNTTEIDLGTPLGAGLGEITLRSILGLVRTRSGEASDVDGTVLDIVARTINDIATDQETVEFQILGSQDKFDWVIGAYGLWRDTSSYAVTVTLPQFRPQAGATEQGTLDRQIAFFGQATVELLDGVHATAGIRTTTSKQSINNRNNIGGTCTLPVGAPGVDRAACTRVASDQDTERSWTLGLDWKFNPDGLIYATTRRGFNQGGFNALALTLDTLTFKPEILDDYEIGIKQDFHFGEAFARFNLALFRSKYKNIQRRNTPVLIINGTPTSSTFIINAAKATIQGAELEMVFAPTRDLRFNLGVGYIDAQYDEFFYTEQRGTFDLTDNKLSQAPKWTVTAAIDYTLPEIAGFGTPSVNLSYSYQSLIVTSDFNDADPTLSNLADPIVVQPGYSLFSARASVDDLFGSGVRLTGWIKNIADKKYFMAKTNAGAIGFASGLPGEPRTFGMTVRKDF
jgi:iron complex outermembrane receptor protein